MAESSASGPSRPKILEQLVEAGKAAFDPSITEGTAKEAGLKRYDDLVQSTETWALLPALNTLIKPNVLPEWLRLPLMQTLTLMPLRPDGVRGTLEFVFSVHPSNAASTSTTAPQKQGASITHEAVGVATRLLSSVPASMTPLAWFQGIAEQLLHLMDGAEGSDLARTAAQIVGFGILGKRQFGAPGSPGWAVFVQPLLDDLNPSLKSESDPLSSQEADDEVVDLRRRKVLVQDQSLERSLQRLWILAMSNPSPGLCKRIIKPVLLQTWVLASWHDLKEGAAKCHKAASELLRTYTRLVGSNDITSIIIPNLLSKGASPESQVGWEYQISERGGIEIVIKRDVGVAASIEIDWSQLQEKAATLVKILESACSAKDISSIFLDLLRRWVKSSQHPNTLDTITTSTSVLPSESPLRDLAEVTILQSLLETAPDKLIGHFDQLLELICQVLEADEHSHLSDDLMAVVLSLLNLVVTAPTFKRSDINHDKLGVVESSLQKLGDGSRPQISQTAMNVGLLLKYRTDLDQDDEPMTAPTARQIEERRVYNLAMSYVTGTDNPPPVVSEGLSLLAGLITKKSSIVDITAVNVLLSNLLSNNEDYINLRVIKMFTQLVEVHPKSTLKELVDHYLDSQEKANTDTRLRFGEALLQAIERLGETFTGEVAVQTCETLLSIAGRRGHRPKTKARQDREEKSKSLKRRKNRDDEDGDVSMDEDEKTEEDKSRDDVLAQIVQGWDSKRGVEDVRMRASALSIYGTALETCITGIGPSLVSNSIDLCVNILTLEPELEKGILRRAAILVVLGFVRALEKAREAGRSLGFGLTDGSREDILRTLQYVASADNDGLVQQHARDVVESLEAWQMASLVSQQRHTENSSLNVLAGLNITPVEHIGSVQGLGSRPRIEEIE